ncbi:MAG: hypothetical protein AUK26_12195 [Syntrophaceae bacterium CG2_30_58_14]|nr:MAG: hypothetical protein AUK26_12195 [Syntrophaceae bacterium CG2_30_58_14]
MRHGQGDHIHISLDKQKQPPYTFAHRKQYLSSYQKILVKATMRKRHPQTNTGEPDRVREQQSLDYGSASRTDELFRDPAFMENREVPVHRWVPWIAGFSARFVEDCFRLFLPTCPARRYRVLDPFAGVGTTLISALQAGHNAVGFEINPYAALACRAKIEAVSIDLQQLDQAIAEYDYASRNGSRTAVGAIPPGFASRIPFFSPQVEGQVHGFFSFLDRVTPQALVDIFKVAFGAVMVGFSNYTYEPSLSTRPGAGKPLIEQADVHAAVLAKLRKIRSDIAWLQSRRASSDAPQGVVHLMSFMEADSVLKPQSVDLAVTSPPYLNNYHYVRNTRPHLYWLGLMDSPNDLRGLEQNNIGKFWQTVRGQGRIDITFEDSDLVEVLGAIRETRTDKGVYGGGGWANYAASYFNDLYRFLEVLSRCMKPGGAAVIVVGNSIIQGHEIKVDQVLGRIALQRGFTLERIEVLRTKRVGASITKSAVRRGETSHAHLYESAVVLRQAGVTR